MIRLFLKFFLLIVLILLVSRSTFEVLLARRIYADRERVVTSVHLGGMRLVARELMTATEERRPAILEKIQLQFRAPLELRPMSELDDMERLKLKQPYGYSYHFDEGYKDHLSIGYDSNQYLRLGPFTNYTAVAFEDSLWGWLRLLVYRVELSDKSQEDLDKLSREFGLPVDIHSKDSVPQVALDRIQTGRDVAFYADQGHYFATTKLNSGDDYLRVGPLPEFKDVSKPVAQTTLTSASLISALLIGLLVYSLSSKFRHIENVARSIARGNLSARADEVKAGEVRELAKALNLMADKTELMIESKRELLQLVSHELRTPLARLRFAVDLLNNKPDDDKRTRRIEIIDQSINDLEVLVSEILDYVKNKEEFVIRSQEWIDVRKAIEPISRSITEESTHLTIEFATGGQDQMPLVYADRIGFLRVAKNIAGNAQRYAKSKLIIRVYPVSASAASKEAAPSPIKSHICVEFEDDGPGIPEEKWLHVIEPFVRVAENTTSGIIPQIAGQPRNPSGQRSYTGIGLGLTIVDRILKQHGGHVQISRGELGGCLVRTYWPNPVSQPPMV